MFQRLASDRQIHLKGTMGKILLDLIQIKKTYTTKLRAIHALKGVSLSLHEGEIISLLGVNGAGKTTLSSIISTLIPASSGQILYDGKSIYEGDHLYTYRSILGFCPQKSNLNTELSLRDNLIYAGRFFGSSLQESSNRADAIMAELELARYANDSSAILSGGYRQRFLIARALMNNPKLVILDEPTVALDPHIRRLIWDKIRHLKKKGISVVLTTHYLDEAEELSDRVCILHDGQIRTIDTPSNLIKNFQKGDLEEVFIQLMKAEE